MNEIDGVVQRIINDALTRGRRVVRRRHRAAIALRCSLAVILLGGTGLLIAVGRAPGRHSNPSAGGTQVTTTIAGGDALRNSWIVASGLTGRILAGTHGSFAVSKTALIALDGTGHRLDIADIRGPHGDWAQDFGTAVLGGYAVVVESVAPNAAGDNAQFGTAVAVRPGTTWQHLLGPATQVIAGEQAGTVWIQTQHNYEDSFSGCTVREVSVAGRVLRRPVRVSCLSDLLGVADGGLVIAGSGDPTQTVVIWNPTTGRATHRFPVPDLPQTDVAAGIMVGAGLQMNCESTCRVMIADLAAARYHTVNLRAAPGMAFPWYDSAMLSANGQYFALEETSLSYDLQQEKLARESPPPPFGGCSEVLCKPTTTGLIAIFDTATGRLVLQRRLSFLSGGSVQWSPDGSWLFVTASTRTIAAVPTSSLSPAVHLIVLTTTEGVGAVGSDKFVVVARSSGT
jgi:hypothetical protein